MGAGAIEDGQGAAAGGTAVVKIEVPGIAAAIVTASLMKTGTGQPPADGGARSPREGAAEIEAATVTIEVLGVRVMILATRALGAVTTEIAGGLATRVREAAIHATVETAIGGVTVGAPETIEADAAIRTPVIVTADEIAAAMARGEVETIETTGAMRIVGAIGVPVIAALATTSHAALATTSASNPNALASGSGAVVTVIPIGESGRARETGTAAVAAMTAIEGGAARDRTTMSKDG